MTATVTVLEPNLSIAKSVSKAHPEPGQSFGYTLTVSNANTILHQHRLQRDGHRHRADRRRGGPGQHLRRRQHQRPTATGGGTISWTLPSPVAKGSSHRC